MRNLATSEMPYVPRIEVIELEFLKRSLQAKPFSYTFYVLFAPDEFLKFLISLYIFMHGNLNFGTS